MSSTRESIAMGAPNVTLTAFITSVTEDHTGITLAADVPPGALTLTTMDAYDLPDSGILHVDGDSTSQVGGEEVAYTAVDRDAGIVTLDPANPITFQHYMGGWFEYRPLAMTRYAWCRFAPDDAESMCVRIPASLDKALTTGDLDDPITCHVRRDGDEWVLVDLPGAQPALAADDTVMTGSLLVVDPDTGEIVATIDETGGYFGYLSADDIDSPGIPARNTQNLTFYVDPANGDDTADGTAYFPLLDTFERTVAPTGWGVADTLQPWVIATNGGNLIDVDGHNGRLRTNGISQTIVMRNSGFVVLDAEITGVINFNVRGAAQQTAELMVRLLDSSNYYSFAIANNQGTITPSIQSKVGGTFTILTTGSVLATLASDAAVAAVDWAIRAQCQSNPDTGGTDLRYKVWDNSTAEPENWTMLASDTTASLQTPGQTGTGTRSGASQSTTEITAFRSFTAASIDQSGFLIDTSLGTVGPLLTVGEALRRVGQWNDGIVRIVMAGNVEETININGIAGGGKLILDGANVATVWGQMACQSSTCYIEMRNFTVQDTGDVGNINGTLEFRYGGWAYVYNVSFQSNTSRGNNIMATGGARVRVEACQLSGSSAYCILALDGAIVMANNNKGSAGTGAYRSSGAFIFVQGTSQPNGANSIAAQGQVITAGSLGSAPPTGGGGTAPTPNTKKTKTVNANATKSWRAPYSPPWRSGDDPIQGSYAGSANSRGFFFYGTACQVSNHGCNSIKVRLKRQSTGGSSSAQAVYVWLHNFKSQSDAGTAGTLQEGPYKVGSLAWGEEKVFTLPVAWGLMLINGTRRGIAIYVGDGSPYIWLTARSQKSNQGQLTISYTP